jgi:hypothetical protein
MQPLEETIALCIRRESNGVRVDQALTNQGVKFAWPGHVVAPCMSPRHGSTKTSTEILHSPETSLSDACIPGIARFWSRGAQTLAEPFETVGDGQLGDEFHALVAELAGQS